MRYTPFFQTLGLDAKFYDQWARDIAMGQSEEGAFFMSPLYPYFLAFVYRLFGRDLLLIRLIQAFLGSCSAVLAFTIARDVFDRRAGLIAGFLTALYGALIFYDGAVLMTPLLVFLSLVALSAIVRADAGGNALLYAAGGVTLGAAAIGRAAALIPAAAVVLWILFSGRGRSSAGPESRSRRSAAPSEQAGNRSVPRSDSGSGLGPALRAAAIVVLGIAVVVVPVTVRNYVVARDFVPITSNGGLNFYIGNSEVATGGYVRPEGLDIVTDPDGEEIAERASGRELKPSEVSAYWYSRARAFIASNPGEWARLIGRKLVFVISSYELPQLENYYFQRRYAPLLSMPLPGFSVVGPLGLLGLALSFRRRRARLLALFTVAYLLSIVAFFVVARYRLPVVPILAVFAAYAILDTWKEAAGRRVGPVVRRVAALGALVFLVNANHYGIDREVGFAQPHFRLGIIYAQRGMVDDAVREFEQAIRLDPGYEKSYLNLGAVLSEAGHSDRAIEVFRRAIRLDPDYDLARINLAMALENQGNYDAALAQIDSVLSADPGNAMALKERGVILYRTGKPEQAAEWLRRAIENDREGEQRAEAQFYLGLIEGPASRDIPAAADEAMARADTLTVRGRITEAVEALEEAARLAPASGEPLRRLALIKREMGLLDEAIAAMREALRLEPALIGGHFTLGLLLNEAGRHDQAINEYEAAIRIDPDQASAHLNLALTYYFHAGNPNLAANHYRRYLALGGDPVPALESVLRELREGGRP